ncbi:MAG: prenyltransferase [Bacteroidales bacterium]
MKIIKKLTFWIDNARYNALPQSLLPAIVAVFAASQQNTFSLFYALLAVMGIIFAHLSMNLLDDYFDYKNKGTTIRNQLAAGGIRSRIAKCEYLTSGQASVKQLLTASALFALLALFFGTFILIKQGIGILYITLITTFFGISYSGIPFKFSYHGMGELVIGLIFGPLLMSGVFYASCVMLSTFIFFISVPV